MKGTLLAAAAAAALGAMPAGAGAATCRGGSAAAVINGKSVCLKAGARCDTKRARQYLRYGYRCRTRKGRRARLVLGTVAERRLGEAVRVGPDGRVDRRTALEAFATAIAPLPGVRRRSGVVDLSRSATPVLRWIRAHRARLSPAQRRAVDAARAKLFPGPRARAASHVAGAEAMFNDAITRIEGHLGPEGDLSIDHTLVTSATQPSNGALATALDVDDLHTCEVTLFPKGAALPPDALYSTLVHEAFHCFQHQWVAQTKGAQPYGTATEWLWEGSAAWAEVVISREHHPDYTDAFTTKYWTRWLTKPWTPLFQRMYGSIGFFAHLAESGINPWPLIRGMVKSSSNTAAYALVRGQQPYPDMLETWASGYVRRPDFGAGWEFTGPGIPTVGPAMPETTLVNGGVRGYAAWPTTVTLGQVLVKADIVRLDVEPGKKVPGRLYSDGPVPLGDGVFCGRPGGCICEAGGSAPDARLASKTLIALTADTKVSVAVFTGQSLDSYCKTAPDAPKVVAGADTFSERGECSTMFTGVPNNFWAGWPADGDSFARLQLYTSGYEGPGDYPTTGGAALGAPTVQVSDGKGKVWETRAGPHGQPNGGFSVDVETATFMRGRVKATVYENIPGDEHGGVLSVEGSWRCKK